jgi:ribosomal protein L40E
MIVCPNCKHDNPEGATNCEACYTALPATKSCPSCGASVQLDATFCGQCGHNLRVESLQSATPTIPPAIEPIAAASTLPPTVLTNPDPQAAAPIPAPTIEPPAAAPTPVAAEVAAPAPEVPAAAVPTPTAPPEVNHAAPTIEPPAEVTPPVATQLQTSPTQVLHLQTNTMLEIPPHLEVITIGKPNDSTPPDLDISGFPHAEVVSRVHASIRREGDSYYIEDLGSANGTYINHNVLPKGNRHLLRVGDRIGLGKGDLVTLIFQPSA